MKRYECGNEGMWEYHDGDYVLYTDALDLQRQLAEVTRERGALQAALKLADALRNREREQCHHYTLANGRDMAINFREAT